MSEEKKLEWEIAIGSLVTAAFVVGMAVMAVASTFFGWLP